jgi:anti-anti-sigma factor
MEISTSEAQGHGSTTILHLKGDLDARSEPVLVERGREIVAQGARHLIVDLSEVRYVSSAGIRALHKLYTLVRPPGDQVAALEGVRDGTYTAHHLKLFNPNSAVREVLDATGLNMYLEVHPDLPSALASLGEH